MAKSSICFKLLEGEKLAQDCLDPERDQTSRAQSQEGNTQAGLAQGGPPRCWCALASQNSHTHMLVIFPFQRLET